MINLTLGDYRICTLKNGTVALYERHIISKRSSPNLGNTVERITGYYSSLKAALSAYTARKWRLMITAQKLLSSWRLYWTISLPELRKRWRE